MKQITSSATPWGPPSDAASPWRSVTAFVAGAAVIALLAGCSSSPGPAQAAVEPTTITVTDQRGVTLEFNGPVERVVTLPMPAASLFVAVDGGVDRLVGMHPSSAKALTDGVLGEFYPGSLGIASDVSGTDFVPNVEAILALDPDVVIQWGDRGDTLTAPLEEAGIKVIGLKYGTHDMLEEWVSIFGTLLGKEERAKELLASFDQARADVEGALARTVEQPAALYLGHANGKYTTSNKTSYISSVMELAGTRNVAADLKVTGDVSIEQILQWNPEIVILSNFHNTSPAEIYANPLWKDVAAVQKKQVYRIPLGGYRWDPPNQESGLMWRWLAQVAHPEIKIGTLRTQIAERYGVLYGVTPSQKQIDRILRLSDNAQSANYDVFAG